MYYILNLVDRRLVSGPYKTLPDAEKHYDVMATGLGYVIVKVVQG